MKKSIKTIIPIVGIMLVGSYALGTTQATTVETVREIEVIPDDYIAIDDCIPLEDIACCYIGNNDLPCFELKDIYYQFDNNQNKSYKDIINTLEDITEDYKNNMLDMSQIADFKTNKDSLQLYLKDGTRYYWER